MIDNTLPVRSLRAEHGKGVVRMEDHYDTDPADLWSALVDPDRLSRWIATVKGELRLGGDFHATFTSGWDGPGRVTECEPHERLVLTMRPGADDETVIEALLTPVGERTHLIIEERGLPLAEVYAHGAGWQAHVEDLAAHLAGRTPDDWETRWHQLSAGYRELAEGLDPSAG